MASTSKGLRMNPYAVFESPLCEIWYGDCREVIANNIENWRGRFDFVFADPPFNIGEQYDSHDDAMSEREFETFTFEWLGIVSDLLRDGGIYVVHVPDEMVWMPLMALPAQGLQRIDWIIWHYRFAQNQSLDTANGFLRSKNHGLVFRKGDAPHTFNSHAVAVESDRATKYNDARINETLNGGMRLPFDVWSNENDGANWGRIQGNNSERIANHPNQLPELYLQRYIDAYTNEGDYIFDPFAGTGTTAVVARERKRNCVTCDISNRYCEDVGVRIGLGMKRRIQELLKEGMER
jgi:DNA modification methylase